MCSKVPPRTSRGGTTPGPRSAASPPDGSQQVLHLAGPLRARSGGPRGRPRHGRPVAPVPQRDQATAVDRRHRGGSGVASHRQAVESPRARGERLVVVEEPRHDRPDPAACVVPRRRRSPRQDRSLRRSEAPRWPGSPQAITRRRCAGGTSHRRGLSGVRRATWRAVRHACHLALVGHHPDQREAGALSVGPQRVLDVVQGRSLRRRAGRPSAARRRRRGPRVPRPHGTSGRSRPRRSSATSSTISVIRLADSGEATRFPRGLPVHRRVITMPSAIRWRSSHRASRNV